MAHEPEKLTAHIRQRLANLSVLRTAATHAEEKIHDAAVKRLAKVDAEIAELRPRAVLELEAGQLHEQLTIERGQLNRILMGSET